jgi:hypothetical protein
MPIAVPGFHQKTLNSNCTALRHDGATTQYGSAYLAPKLRCGLIHVCWKLEVSKGFSPDAGMGGFSQKTITFGGSVADSLLLAAPSFYF